MELRFILSTLNWTEPQLVRCGLGYREGGGGEAAGGSGAGWADDIRGSLEVLEV